MVATIMLSPERFKRCEGDIQEGESVKENDSGLATQSNRKKIIATWDYSL